MNTEDSGKWEKVVAEFNNREFRFFKDTVTEEFSMLYFLETDEEDRASAVDSVWEDEIDTVLSETARAKMVEKRRLEGSDDKYQVRLAELI